MPRSSPSVTDPTVAEPLAIDGGPKAFAHQTGKCQPKVGVAEFFAIAERFGFNDQALQRLRDAVSDADLTSCSGPHLGRYYGSASPSMGQRWEALACRHLRVKHAYAVANGTCGLTAAVAAIGAGPQHEVIIPATGFIATALAAAALRATPVFCDIDESMQMDPSRIEALITDRTIAIMPTHHWGYVADMDPIMAIARRQHLRVIEDCAQSPGATYHGQSVGTIGDIGCFSISSYKLIGGGEGGLVVTHDDRLFDRIRQAAEAGGLWRDVRFAAPRYEGELFPGGNYRMSELESAVNVVQIQKLPEVVARCRRVFRRFTSQLADYREITWQKSNDPDGDVGYMLRFFPANDALGAKIAQALVAEGLSAGYQGGQAANPDWHCCKYFFPLFADPRVRQSAEACTTAADLYNRCLRVSVDQWWSDADCDAAARAVNKVLSAFCTPA